MRRILLLCATILAAVSPLLAADFVEEGIYYNVTSEEGAATPTVEVTYTGDLKKTTTYTGEITIPDKVTHEGTEYTVTALGDYSFYCSSKNTNVTAVSLPTTITSIGEYAFYYCQGLTSINIPDGVTTIGQYAFYNCSALAGSITIPDGVTVIETYAFYGTALTEITLPEHLTTIASSAFRSCSALTSIKIPDTVTSIGTYAFSSAGLTAIEIPEAITEMENYIFYQCSSLKDVKLPSGLTSIGTYEFYKCTSLEEITIPDGVTEIGGYTFYGCTSLKKVNIPEGVTTIGADLFYQCYALESVTLPEGTLTISGSAMRYAGLKEIVIPDKAADVNYTYILANCTSLEKASIGSGVPALGTYFFSNCTALKEITSYNPTPPTCTNTNVFGSVPTSCVLKVPTQSIDAYKADTYWSVFTNVEGIGYLPEVTTLDATDVAHTTAVFNATVTTYEAADAIIEQGFEYWGDDLVVHKIAMENGGEMSVTVSDLEKASYYTYCAYAKTESHTMYGAQLSFTTLPGDFTYNGLNYEYGEEDGTCAVTCCFIDPTASKVASIYNPTADTRYVGEFDIPATVSYNGKSYTVVGVGEYAFYYCSEVTSVTFPETLEYISDYAFDSAGLTSVDIPDNVTTLGRWAFEYNNSMTSAKIGDGITEIGSSAFYFKTGNSKLTDVIIGDNVEVIGANAFQYADIHEIMLPAKVTQLGNNAFYGNGNLIKVTSLNPEPPACGSANVFKDRADECQLYVPKGADEAYRAAEVWQDFSEILVVGEPTLATVGSSNLTKGTATLTGTIAENAYDITERGFEYWTSTDDVMTIVASTVDGNDVSATATGLTADTTYSYRVYAKYNISDTETGTTYGKEKTYSTAQNADFFVDGFFYIYNEDGTCSLTYRDEEYNTYSSAITVPDATTYLEKEYAVTGIGASTFRECAGLTAVTIPEAATSIGIFAFYNCTSLTEITIPDAVTSIGNQAFNGCSALTKATIGSSVESLGQSAFANCSALAELYTLNPEPPTCGTQAFNNVDHETCTLYVPDRTYDAYSTTNTWQDFYIVEMTEFAVETYEATDVTDVSAVLNGYIAEDYTAQGSITSKGFVYWEDDKDSGTTITVDDSNKTIAYAVEGLSSETTYTYCAFAVTNDGTTYGEEKTFTTAVPTGINGIHISIDDENVEGIYSTDGQKRDVALRGINIIRYTDGTVKKIYVK